MMIQTKTVPRKLGAVHSTQPEYEIVQGPLRSHKADTVI